jgi:hypothetical protein
MKIKHAKKKNQKNSLIKLKFLQTKIYNNIYYIRNLKIEDIFYRLIKSFKILYKYNIFNKKILFLNNSIKIYINLKMLLRKTNHSYKMSRLKQKNIIKNKNNLLVIIKQSINYCNFLKIDYNKKIPNIIITNNTNNFNIKGYKNVGNFFNQSQDQFFVILLLSLFKR